MLPSYQRTAGKSLVDSKRSAIVLDRQRAGAVAAVRCAAAAAIADVVVAVVVSMIDVVVATAVVNAF
jgi:hypothetical protein